MRPLAALALAWSTAWGAAPFSHRVHLQTGLECVNCHTAARGSTKVEDNLLPAKRVCLDCHESAEIPPPPSTRLTKFSHALHLKMGDVAPYVASAIDHKTYFDTAGVSTAWIRSKLGTKNPCEACHRGLEESDRVTRAALPQMADCLVCHTVIDPPFSCEDCHAKDDESLKPASHTQIPHFTDAHSSGKLKLDKTTCAICHGRTFRCMGCH